ncbi:MAG: hypothetical protein ABW217_06325 [Polyangiaceae bacterium]
MVVLSCAGVAGCTREVVPDPRTAAREWEEALRRDDRKTIYEMLTAASQRAYGAQGVERLLGDNRDEIVALAGAARASDARVRATATLTYGDGQVAELVLEEGRFRVLGDEALPLAAKSPSDALRQLRAALQRRSYGALLRLLTRETRWMLESEVQALVEALEEPGGLQIKVEGRRAKASLPGGHTVTLEHEDGVWTIKDFD